jgi:ABC-type glycerol-3-phosphate transport system substrate-binding protein
MSGRKMSRRTMLKGLGLAAAGTALAGCAPKVVKETVIVEKPVEKVVEKVVTATAAPLEPVTLRYQNHWSREGDAHYTTMDWLYKTFQEQNPNVKLDVQVIPSSSESTKKMTADCAAGDCPDIVHEVYMDYYDAGWLVDLAPYIDSEWRSRLISEVLDELTWDGHTYGISVEYSPMSSIWNTALLDEVGKDIPKTWDEFLALGEALKSKDLYLTSFQGGMGGHGFTALLFGRPGAAEAMAKGEFDCEQVLYAWSRLKEIVDGGFIVANEIELNWKQLVPLFQTNKIAMYPNGAWHIRNSITAEGADPELRNHVAFTPFPATAGGLGRTIQLMNATAVGLGSQLLKEPKRLDAAIAFLKLFTSVESAGKFVTEAQSPTGVKADVPADKVPLLAGFLGAMDEADVVFSLPASKILRQKAWGHQKPGREALLLGKSAEEATQLYAEGLSEK